MTHKTCMNRAGALALAALLCAASAPAAALQFDGVNDSVNIPDNTAARISGPITVEAWVNRSVSGVQHSIVEKYGCGGVGGYVLRVTSANKLLFGTRDDCNNGSSVVGATSIPANNWTHVAGHWDGTTLRVFVNGVLDGTLAATRNPKAGNSALKIGERGNGGTPFFGMIDEVRLWNVARTGAQIVAAKDVCLAGNETGLAGYWRFEEGVSALAHDATGNANHGALVNEPVWTILGAPITCGPVMPPPPPPGGSLPTVRVFATAPEAFETFPDGIHTLIPGIFTVWRTGSDAADLTVFFNVSGSAGNGVDYVDVGNSVVIPAGSPSALIGIVPFDDFLVEGNEDVVVSLATNAAYQVSFPTNATVFLLDNDPTVSIEAPVNTASEGGGNGQFRITRTGPTTAPLPVFFHVAGTALPNADFVPFGSGVLMPAGQSSVTITVAAINDALVEGTETIVVTLDLDPAYTVGLPLAKVSILDNDGPDAFAGTPLVSVVATAAAAEISPDALPIPEVTTTNVPGIFTVTRSGPTSSPLTINYTMSGAAQNGIDYEALLGTVIIPAGAVNAQVPFYPIDDGTVEGTETVTMTVAPGAGYLLGAFPSATEFIADNDPTVSVEAIDAIAAETGDPGMFRFKRTGPTTSPLLVSIILIGAEPGLDFVNFGTFVSIPAGASFVDVPIIPIDDQLLEGAEVLEVEVAKLATYTVGAGAAAVTIDDDDVPPPPPVDFTMSVIDSQAAEAGAHPATLLFTRTGSTNLPLAVFYSLAGTAVKGTDYLPIFGPALGTVEFPAGVASMIVPLVPIDDAVAEPTETILLTVLPSLDYFIIGTNRATLTILDNEAPVAPPPAALTALQFNGVNQSVQIPASASVQITGPITVEAWVRRSITGVQHSIVEKYGCSGLGGYVLRVTANDKLLFGTRDDCNNGTSVVGVTTLAANTWYHVAGTWDGTALRIYVNGVLDTAALPTTRNPKAGNTPLKIGERGNGGTPFNGLIDDARVWNVARTAAQILGGMSQCVPGNSAGLAGNWRFDEAAGATANDATPNANHGALVNNPARVISTAPTTCP